LGPALGRFGAAATAGTHATIPACTARVVKAVVLLAADAAAAVAISPGDVGAVLAVAAFATSVAVDATGNWWNAGRRGLRSLMRRPSMCVFFSCCCYHRPFCWLLAFVCAKSVNLARAGGMRIKWGS